MKLLLGLRTKLFLATLAFCLSNNNARAQSVMKLKPFSKIVVSSFIDVNFQQDDEDYLEIKYLNGQKEKFRVENSTNTLHLFYEGARYIPKSHYNAKKQDYRRSNRYKSKMASITVHFVDLNKITIAGEEQITFTDQIKLNTLDLIIMGEHDIYFDNVHIDQLYSKIYGECHIKIKDGNTGFQRFSVFGEVNIDASKAHNNTTEFLVFGELQADIHVADKLKTTVYGEANIRYIGNPSIKRTTFGELNLQQVGGHSSSTESQDYKTRSRSSRPIE